MATFVLHTVHGATIVVDVWSVAVAIQRAAVGNWDHVCHRGCRAWGVFLLDMDPRPALMPPGRPRRHVRC